MNNLTKTTTATPTGSENDLNDLWAKLYDVLWREGFRSFRGAVMSGRFQDPEFREEVLPLMKAIEDAEEEGGVCAEVINLAQADLEGDKA